MQHLNDLIIKGVSIAIQVTLVFVFLTVFFFNYVQKIEKKEFVSQINLVVDNIIEDLGILTFERQMVAEKVDKKIIVKLIENVIDILEENATKNFKNTDLLVKKQNNATETEAYKLLFIVIVSLVFAILLFKFFRFHIPVRKQIKDGIKIVIFIALTEFVFLHVIVKNYITADPNTVKRNFGKSIHKWIEYKH